MQSTGNHLDRHQSHPPTLYPSCGENESVQSVTSCYYYIVSIKTPSRAKSALEGSEEKQKSKIQRSPRCICDTPLDYIREGKFRHRASMLTAPCSFSKTLGASSLVYGALNTAICCCSTHTHTHSPDVIAVRSVTAYHHPQESVQPSLDMHRTSHRKGQREPTEQTRSVQLTLDVHSPDDRKTIYISLPPHHGPDILSLPTQASTAK